MLVLTRRVDESIAVGENILITVLGIEGDRVKIGISAPRDIPILRHEVYEAVKGQAILQTRLAENPAPDTFEQLRKLLEEDSGREDEDKTQP
jgi:carbon storage regulator